MKANIPEVENKRIVIIGGGFAGLTLARKLIKSDYQIVLVDKHNYHVFQPLLYQVATAGLEPSAIAFPYRKIFQSKKNIHIRMTEVLKIEPEKNHIVTRVGIINYDYLVIATGATTNYINNGQIQEKSYPMKSVSEALGLRNTILQNFENYLSTEDPDAKQSMMNFVVVGGGPTGVELCGALAEMRRFVLPKDYPDIDFNIMNIYLVGSSPRLLNNMSDISSKKASQYLSAFNIKIIVGTAVNDYDGKVAILSDGTTIRTDTLIWTAGVKANTPEGIHAEKVGKSGRLIVDQYSKIEGYSNIYAVGDVAIMTTQEYANGHKQAAQVAIQQAANLANNFIRIESNKPFIPFKYKNLGAMATIGRNRAVVELSYIKFQGFFAWFLWMFIHLKSILGVKNKVLVFINWIWNYLTYDQSLRLIIKAKTKS